MKLPPASLKISAAKTTVNCSASLGGGIAGAAIHVNDLNARLLLGQQINIVEHAHAISTMVRVASRIGIDRLPRDVSPTLSDILCEDGEARD
jgi:hypothetical protein